jgi:hypothetical protein
MKNKWNTSCYSGPLDQYDWPADKEVGRFLYFLKECVSKRIWLVDQLYWQPVYINPLYDIVIICCFGEFVNEAFLDKIDADIEMQGKRIILITSQYFDNPPYKNIKVFYVEHLHTTLSFLELNVPYKKIADRSMDHCTLIGRPALHKVIILSELQKLNKFDYTFSGFDSGGEYKLKTLKESCNYMFPGFDIEPYANLITSLHIPKTIPGDTWSIKNTLHEDTRINWVLESIFLTRHSAPTSYITEKTLKTYISGSASIIIGQQDCIKRITSCGFKTFDKILGLPDYDSNNTDTERLDLMLAMIRNFDAEYDIDTMQEIVDYNYDYIHMDFAKNIEYSNQNRIKKIVEYVNS